MMVGAVILAENKYVVICIISNNTTGALLFDNDMKYLENTFTGK